MKARPGPRTAERPVSNRIQLSAPAMAQLERLLRLHGLDPLARKLSTSPTTLMNASRGAYIRADVAHRLMAAIEMAS